MIRPAQRRDLTELVELCALHARHEGLAFEENGQPARWEEALFAEPPALHAWVVEAPGGKGLLGYMTAVVEYSTWAARDFVYMDCLYVRERGRRQGHGRRLVETLQAFARERGIHELQWQTPPGNALGLDFYRRIGARPLEKIRFALGADARKPAA
ncbi:MAG TPA: GNAT family N-acetyltransferase [Allosphingosinicella sp.]